jgi:hypothetical protein
MRFSPAPAGKGKLHCLARNLAHRHRHVERSRDNPLHAACYGCEILRLRFASLRMTALLHGHILKRSPK